MSCKMKIEQLKEAVAGGNEEVKSGEFMLKWISATSAAQNNNHEGLEWFIQDPLGGEPCYGYELVHSCWSWSSW